MKVTYKNTESANILVKNTVKNLIFFLIALFGDWQL
jgi:hypothetical protein